MHASLVRGAFLGRVKASTVLDNKAASCDLDVDHDTQDCDYRTSRPWPTTMFLHLLAQLVFLSAILYFRTSRGALTELAADPPASGCQNPLQRQEWRQLSRQERRDYIDAILCLQNKPALLGFQEARSLFDDFQALHISLTEQVHTVGQFLPWHRLFVWTYEATLRRECGYQGTQPYWDWTLDSSDSDTLLNSPIFDTYAGFGSAVGRGDNDTVIDGPFSNYTLAYGIGPVVNNHILHRRPHFEFLTTLTQDQVDNTTKQTNFEDFRIELEGKPITPLVKIHDSGHRLIGGDMADTYSSPGDPLFYLHHANLDRIWLNWQKVAPERMYQVSGRTSQKPPFRNLTLDFILKMDDLGPSRPVRDVTDAENGLLCYGYDDNGDGSDGDDGDGSR